jgi:hypothetical protein
LCNKFLIGSQDNKKEKRKNVEKPEEVQRQRYSKEAEKASDEKRRSREKESIKKE